MSLHRFALLCAASLALCACGGTKLVRDAAPVPQRELPIAVAADATLAVQLDFIVVRNGPGAWARNGNWDEYLIRVRNTSALPVELRAVEVTDSQGHNAVTLDDRADLVAASKLTAKRYRQAGVKVAAGSGGAGLVAAGVGAGVVGYGAAVASVTSAALGSGGAAGGGAAAAAGGFLLAAPVLVGVGIVRVVNNAKVDKRIESRATALPVTIPAGSDVLLDVFFPITPSPRELTFHYRSAQGDQQLQVDTSQVLAGLHLAPAPASGQ
jgi:hypothetical protein